MAAKHYSKVAQRYHETGKLDNPPEADEPAKVETTRLQPVSVAD